MRTITAAAVGAFLTGTPIALDNTTVSTEPGNTVVMRLHGNPIAILDGDGVTINTCGWHTLTTMERLNGLPGVKVRKVNGQLMLNGEPWDGTAITLPHTKDGC